MIAMLYVLGKKARTTQHTPTIYINHILGHNRGKMTEDN